MTGTQSVYALGGAALFVIIVWFLGKLVLRLAGRKVVKVYPVALPFYPPPTYIQNPPPIHPTEFCALPHLPHVSQNDVADVEANEMTDDEQFDDIVRNFYST